METGSELSKTVATFILQKILLDDSGLSYICQTYDRFSHVAIILVSQTLFSIVLLINLILIRLLAGQNGHIIGEGTFFATAKTCCKMLFTTVRQLAGERSVAAMFARSTSRFHIQSMFARGSIDKALAQFVIEKFRVRQ
jgi:hypothetical protein